MAKRLSMINGELYDDPPPQRPLVLLDCETCAGWQRFDHLSATVVRCKACETEQSNENLVDLNEERL